MIVSTSALELSIDVGDLDRVIQLNAPPTIAAFLQRLGLCGRRAGTVRNCVFRAIDEENLLLPAGLLHAWGRGFVEPVPPSPSPRHIVAQPALCLQEKRVGEHLWTEWLSVLALTESAAPITSYLIEQGFVEREDGMLFIGPTAERKFGRRHFMGLMATFTAPPEFTVLHGRDEVGRTDPMLLVDHVTGPRCCYYSAGGRGELPGLTGSAGAASSSPRKAAERSPRIRDSPPASAFNQMTSFSLRSRANSPSAGCGAKARRPSLASPSSSRPPATSASWRWWPPRPGRESTTCTTTQQGRPLVEVTAIPEPSLLTSPRRGRSCAAAW